MLALLWITPDLLAQAERTITDDDLLDGDYRWSSDTTYLLDGLVILNPGGKLTIELGTVIKGKMIDTETGTVSSVLAIAAGAKIFAEGTAEDPIIFTSEVDDINDPQDVSFSDRGLWGGLLILGNAPIASPVPTSTVEGLGFYEDTEQIRYGGEATEDSSGVLRYVSIRHAGAEIAAGEEINGLSLSGVGSGTIVEHIEVYACQDDGIEMRGGTVNLRNLSVSFCSDESIDWDEGWRGKGQFWLAMQDEESDRCGEHDGGIPDNAEPFSKPIISNVTYIGPGQNESSSADEAILFRDRSGGVYANSIFIDFPNFGLRVENRDDLEDSYDHLESGNLLFNCNFWWRIGQASQIEDVVRTTDNDADLEAVLLKELLAQTTNLYQDPLLANLNKDPELFDPRPQPASPVLGGACPLDDPFFEPVTYAGAFGPDEVWLADWSGMAANAFFERITTSVESITPEEAGLSLFPNPMYDQAVLHLELSTWQEGALQLQVMDQLGRIY